MKTCLVVDDSSVIRKVARRILEGLNFKISEAEDGQQALEEFKLEMPDAVLLEKGALRASHRVGTRHEPGPGAGNTMRQRRPFADDIMGRYHRA